jgi:predicted transcriptional regulator
LAPREQEVAAIVYLNANITASELELALSRQVSNAAIRSMLSRLVAKGVLQRRKGEGKSHFIYSPAVFLPEVQERALERAAGEFFGGSLSEVGRCLIRIMERSDPNGFPALARHIGTDARTSTNSLAAAG